MPYIQESSRKAIDINRRTGINTVGDLNYVYTLYIIEEWIKSPRYKTIHKLRKVLCQGWESDIIKEIDRDIGRRGWDTLDIKTAKQLAFNEFYLKVGRNYETKKAIENGDVYAGVPYADTVSIQDTEQKVTKRVRRRPLSGGGK